MSLVHKNLFNLVFLIQLRMKDIVQGEDSGLTPMQILILRILTEDGAMSQAELGHKVGRDKALVTRVVQEMEKKGLVQRKRSLRDRRSFTVNASSEAGNKTAYFLHKEHELVEEMLAGISINDTKKLEGLLAQMLKNLHHQVD